MISSITSVPRNMRVAAVASYTVASAVSAMSFFLLVWLLATKLWSPPIAVAVAGALAYGLSRSELGLFIALPSRHWQVPARWVARPLFGPAVWGFILGPGAFTHCPYPGYVVALAIVAASDHSFAAVVVGLIFGTVRAAPVGAWALRPVPISAQECSMIIGQGGAWRFAESTFLLLLGASVLVWATS